MKALVVILLIGLYFTNPTKVDFIKYAFSQGGAIYESVASTISEEDEAGLNLLMSMAGISIKRNNYVVFSVFSLNDGDTKGKVIGIAKNFILLDK